MALRHIVTEGDEILRKHCREVTEVTERIRQTMTDMLETMRAEFGVGIAAPQVGIMRRMFVAEPEPGRVYYMINPVILEQSGSQTGDEGCLSVPGLIGTVDRPSHIKIDSTMVVPPRRLPTDNAISVTMVSMDALRTFFQIITLPLTPLALAPIT